MYRLQRRILTAVLAVVAHPKITLAICGAVLAGCVALALTRLTIDTDQDKLFSPNVPFFSNYLHYVKEFPENEAIYVIIEPKTSAPPSLQRWTAAADQVADALNAMPQFVLHADAKVPLERLGDQGLLFAEPKELPALFDSAKQLLPLGHLWGEPPTLPEGFLGKTAMQRFLAGISIKPGDDQEAQFATLLAKSWTRVVADPKGPIKRGAGVPDLARLGADNPLDLGYFYQPDATDSSRHLLLVQVAEKDDTGALAAGARQIAAIRAAVDGVGKDYPEFDFGVTGRPALDDDEMATTSTDTDHAEYIAFAVVFVGMAFTLRSIWLALVAEVTLIIAIGWTFGWATITLGELNLLSIVFLIALIGIGMDYLIQILTRYEREAKRYTRPAAIWTRVFRYVSPPILTACLGAAGAFFVSVFTDFRGAAELGIVAGGGLLLCLVAGYTVLPALLTIFPASVPAVDPSERYAPVKRRRGAIRLLLPAAWLLALALVLPYANPSNFNPNLIELQAQNLESVKLVKRIQTWDAVVMSEDLAMLRKVRESLAGAKTVSGTDSILNAYDNLDWITAHQNEAPRIQWTAPTPITAGDLPGIASAAAAAARRYGQTPLTTQERQPAGVKTTPAPAAARTAPAVSEAYGAAAEALSDLNQAIDAAIKSDAAGAAARLSQWQNVFVDELKDLESQLHPTAVNISALPRQLLSHYLGSDGKTFALYINPQPGEDLWKRGPLGEFVREVEAHVGSVPDHPPVTGIASDIYYTTGSIRSSFFKATIYALVLVIVLVYLDLRSIKETLITISVLALGLPMLVSLMGIFDVSWNFANFFGLPILIGAGHEYGVFMVHRYKEVLHNPRRTWKRWDVSDRALLLCAFVTSSSFGFFWALGHHRGLRSLGLVMAVGTACIYLSALVVVRPLLKWRLERRMPENAPPDATPAEPVSANL